MKLSIPYLMPILALATTLFVVSCGDSEHAESEPKTPEEMYAKAEALIKPNVENAASDFKGALSWLRKAAEAGYLKAQTDLGGIYLNGGDGIEADLHESLHWFSMAAAQGSAEAHYFLALILGEGSKDLPADLKSSMAHLKIAAEAALPVAMYHLGLLYLDAEAHAQHGLSLIEAAADAGLSDAARDLGFLYTEGAEFVARDLDKGILWFKHAAALGDAKALYIVGMMHYRGHGIEQDVEKALAELRLSAGQDFVPAMQALAEYLNVDTATQEMKKEAQAWKEEIEAYEAHAAKEAKKLATEAGEAVEQAPIEPFVTP